MKVGVKSDVLLPSNESLKLKFNEDENELTSGQIRRV